MSMAMTQPVSDTPAPEALTYAELSFGEALHQAQQQAMELDPKVFIYGLGVDRTGAIFGSTKGLPEQFGAERVFDTPVSEQALTAMAAGAANSGLRPVLVHQRLDFMLYTMDMVVNWISLWHFKSAGRSKLPLVIRAVVGKGWGQGPQHGKSLHSWFAHLPGLQVVMPSSPADAKGLLMASIFSNAPTIFIEGRSLYSMTEMVPDAPYMIPIGKAHVRREGHDITLVSMGMSVVQALRAAELLAESGISAEVVDLRSVAPLDMETVLASVRKTKRLVVAEPGWRMFGTASEIVANVAEAMGPELKSAPAKVTWPHSHVPTSAPLETQFYPTLENLVEVCRTSVGKG